jgi:hypothetical protein
MSCVSNNLVQFIFGGGGMCVGQRIYPHPPPHFRACIYSLVMTSYNDTEMENA